MLSKIPPKLNVGQKVKLIAFNKDKITDLDKEALEKGWYNNGDGLVGLDRDMSRFFGHEVTIKIVLNGYFNIEEDGENGWIWSAAWIDQVLGSKTIDLALLKIANSVLSATHCASCGNQLKDPGMGPIYQHCPKCEP